VRVAQDTCQNDSIIKWYRILSNIHLLDRDDPPAGDMALIDALGRCGSRQTSKEIFSNSTVFTYQPFSNFTDCLNPKQMDEMVKFTQELVA